MYAPGTATHIEQGALSLRQRQEVQALLRSADAEALREQRKRAVWKTILPAAAGVAVLVAAFVAILQYGSNPGRVPPPPPIPPGDVSPSSGSTPSSGPTPAPWTYDPATNRHWDPNHNHWHNGPPPDGNG